MSNPLAPIHYSQIVALLKASEIQARVVSGDTWMGVEVREGGQRILWTNVRSVPDLSLVSWCWTRLDADGKVSVGESLISGDADPEDVVLAIITAYAVPEDGPSL